MLFLLALAAAAAQPAATPPVPAPAPSRFGAIVTDWQGANRDSIEQEQARNTPPPPPRTETQARGLGERVGRMVAEGDCEGGERAARQAADFALVRAVREHCGSRGGRR